MSTLLTSASIDAITLFTEDLKGSKAFYADVFGLPMVYEDANSAVFRFDNTVINLLAIPAAHELIEPGKVADPTAGALMQFTIGVDDVDAVCTELARAGLAR
jgi:catechol 2,3-dioxygenase-like lactoylglutathione lyase family enzyme